MTIQSFDNHSLDVDLLPDAGGVILDVGAYGWGFSREMASRGHTVHAMDPAPGMADPGIEGVIFHPLGLVGERATARVMAKVRDRDGWHLVGPDTPAPADVDRVTVPVVDLATFMDEYVGVEWWDAVKLNCEGAELGILASWPGPVARQISASFHEHVWPEHQNLIDNALAHVGEWYDVVQHQRDERYSAGPNLWDTLLCLKGDT